ncbi:MAG TPA: cyclase family protein [Burkholderiales bacterium]|jgi:kynurenine formamidase|nr:cyclase family protein [Burkholderiales bacterium]
MKLSTAAGTLAALSIFVGGAIAEDFNDKPFEQGWWPSKWGAEDSAGSSNHTKNPANVKRALGVIKQFKVVTIGRVYHREMPNFGVRSWNLTIPGTPTGGPFGKNGLLFHDEMVTAEIGQVGTQFDGPGHIGVHTSKGDFMYNGRPREQVYERGPGGRVLGMGKNGVEYVAENGFVCRAVLLDAVAYRKSQGKLPASADKLPIPTRHGDIGIITADDIKAMFKLQRVAELQPGDCVFMHTGHGNGWANSVYGSLTSAERAAVRAYVTQGEPGYGASACEYFGARDIALQGGDASSNEAQPAGEEDGYAVPCHTNNQARRGIWNIENLDLKPLADAGVHEFAFIWAPLRIVGGTGSPANPIAIY